MELDFTGVVVVTTVGVVRDEGVEADVAVEREKEVEAEFWKECVLNYLKQSIQH